MMEAMDSESSPSKEESSSNKRKPSARRKSSLAGAPKKAKVVKAEKIDTESLAEDLAAVYTNKDFEPPKKGELETIFESDSQKKQVRGTSAEDLAIGKNLKKRFIEQTPYWIEDKVKSRHRAKMVTKSCRGRKRTRFYGLTEEQEEHLNDILRQKADLSDEDETPDKSTLDSQMEAETSCQVSQPENQCPNVSSAPSAPASPIRTATPTFGPSSPQPSSFLPSTPSTPTPKQDPVAAKKKRRRSSLLMKVLLPPSDQPLRSSFTDTEGNNVLICEGGPTPKASPMRSPSVSRTPARMERTPSLEEQEEIKRQIEEADSFFGAVGTSWDDAKDKTRKVDTTERLGNPSKKRRDSIAVQVRRSSRLIRRPLSITNRSGVEMMDSDPDESLGSVFHLAEVNAKCFSRRKAERLS